jgi:hypothetical protein
MKSPIQSAMLVALASILKPIVKLTLQTGLGYSEFIEVAKSVFVHVAAENYGLRGRPTNMSRISAMTGISRKEVSRLRSEGFPGRWTPDKESSPASTVLHYWHYDPTFVERDGTPRILPFDGPDSFSTLVKRYAGDIPPGAMRTELCRRGTAREVAEGRLAVLERWFRPAHFDEDFIHRFAYSLQHLAATIVHNGEVLKSPDFSPELPPKIGRFERYAWTEHFTPLTTQAFKEWVRREGTSFIDRADGWIGENEIPRSEWTDDARSVGVGIYYFEEES